ncbi:MAG: tRNA pseudouridine(38-40) synthase TruA [bacterium]
MRNIKAILEYDGTPYYGMQYQPHLPTIQGVIESCWSKVLGHPVRITAAGRTDAGVHAEGQVVSFFTSSTAPMNTLLRSLNALLPDSITVKSVEEVPLEFHSRFWAKKRIYVYRILHQTERSSLWKWRYFCTPLRLKVEKLQEAGMLFEGQHNFYAFCAGGTPRIYAEKTITSIRVTEKDNLIELQFIAPSFLPRMVRMIGGAIFDYACGLCPREVLEKYLCEAQKKFPHILPPWGLYLQAVLYKE